jgi:DNA (cytosine-5)-methyltransferase 1
VLNSKKYGVPQNRERIFIIGIRDDVDNQFTWQKEMHLQMKLKDVFEDDVDDKYFLSNTQHTTNSRLNNLIEKHGKNLTDNTFLDSYNNTIHKGITPTITSRVNASSKNHVVKEQKIRRLTPRECFRLQDFPDSFKFVVSDTQLYKQAGNSITIAVLAAIINKLKL